MMLPENPLTGYAESSIDLEFDMLHDSDCCDFEYGDPAEWAEWTDEFRWDLGPDDDDALRTRGTLPADRGGLERLPRLPREGRDRTQLRRQHAVCPLNPFQQGPGGGTILLTRARS